MVTRRPNNFPFNIGQFPFHTLTNSVGQPIFTSFAAFLHQNYACFIWYGSFLQFYYLWSYVLLTQETRFSKSCSNWKFCFKPQILLWFQWKRKSLALGEDCSRSRFYQLYQRGKFYHNFILQSQELSTQLKLVWLRKWMYWWDIIFRVFFSYLVLYQNMYCLVNRSVIVYSTVLKKRRDYSAIGWK